MFYICSDQLVDDVGRFAARNGHRFFESWDYGDGQDRVIRTGGLREKEIVDWVSEPPSSNVLIQSRLRILLCPKPSGHPSSGKLPFSRETYISLVKSWRIPPTFLRAVTQKLSLVTQCSVAPIPDPALLANDPSPPLSSNISSSAHCLLIRGDVDWTWDYTLLLTHDPLTHSTYILITGLTATEIDLVHKHLDSPSVSEFRSLSTHPLLLPLVLLNLATEDTSFLLKLRVKLLSLIQQRTGMDRFNTLKHAAIDGDKESERRELNLDAIMLRLTCLSDWVAAQRSFIASQRRVLEVVDRMLGDSSRIPRMRECREVETMFRESLSFIRETLLSAEGKCTYLERSIGAQVQTIYSLIGQKDNRLNIAAASASCQIASDSRRIAILTRRDSTDMRIIAAVTLLFLPGTFIATVFSTGLFDWKGEDGKESKLVSGYLWVYFMLTGVLTAVILLAWGVFSWVQNRAMVKRFGGDLETGDWMREEVDGKEKRERRETDMTLVEEGRRARVWREFEKWKIEAGGKVRGWRGKKAEESKNV